MTNIPAPASQDGTAAKQIRDVLEVQGRDGNWNSDQYMLGLYNGMEMALSIVEGREPIFRKKPEQGSDGSGPAVTEFNVGRWCLSEDDCIAQGIDFAAYERGVSDAAKAFGAATVPRQRDGWRLAPVEPTEAMEQAAADYLDACVKAHGLWGAMLDAAPAAPAAIAPPEAMPPLPELPELALSALIEGPFGSEYRPLSKNYEPNCAQFSANQMHAYAANYARAALAALRSDSAASASLPEPAQPAHCMCPACRYGVTHHSDCAVHNLPAAANGPCDCGALDRHDWLTTARKLVREAEGALARSERSIAAGGPELDEPYAVASDALDDHLKAFTPASPLPQAGGQPQQPTSSHLVSSVPSDPATARGTD